jgi:hypoxanthine phosphoribosyltransferase
MSSDSFECEIMSWELFNELAKKVAEKMREDDYRPDFMVGLARGGWVLSRVLCDYLGIKDLVSLKVEHWGVTATPDGKAQIKYPIDIDLTGRNVVVVDDITDTGESMKVAIDHIKKLNPRTLRTAALRNIEGSSFTPDYFGDEIKWRWVVFPWNFVEDMCNIIPKASEGVKDLLDVQRNLKERHNIELSISEIEDINEEVERRN